MSAPHARLWALAALAVAAAAAVAAAGHPIDPPQLVGKVEEAYEALVKAGPRAYTSIDEVNKAIEAYEEGDAQHALAMLDNVTSRLEATGPSGRSPLARASLLALVPPLYYAAARLAPALAWYYARREWRVRRRED